MKRKNLNKVIALLLTATMGTMTACGSQTDVKQESEVTQSAESTSAVSEEKEASDEVIDVKDLPTISVYSQNASLMSGKVTGHRADYFAENGFQVEVWAFSDEKTNAILASGDLPDVMHVPQKYIEDMINAGMILNLEEHLDKMPHLYSSQYMEGALDNVRKNASAGTGELYGLPVWVGEQESTLGYANYTDRYGLKIRWDAYEEIGAPEIKDVWELIDVMEQMVAAHPTEEDGTKIYGTVLNSGSDSSYWGNMALYFYWFGYRESYLANLIEADMVNGTVSSILSEDSKYYEGLKWYNEVYRRGLMDPDSINIDRATQASKPAMVPSGTLPGWSPGCLEYLLPGTSIYYDNCSELGSTSYILAINADTENLDAALGYLDMMCNPDAYFRLTNGPEGGGIWYTEGDDLYYTERLLEYAKENGSKNGFILDSGEEYSLYNTAYCVLPGVPMSYNFVGNEDYQQAVNQSDNFANWQKTMGYTSWKELLADKDGLCDSSRLSGISSYLTLEDDQMKLQMDSLKTVVVNASWQMVYAETEEEFEKIWDQMVKDCIDLDAEKMIEWKIADIENAIALNEAAAK